MSNASVQLKPRTENLTGRKFGFLTVVRFAGYAKGARWECSCECGLNKVLCASNLRRGHVVSCGCGIRSRVAAPVVLQPEWNCYMGMIDRCRNPNNRGHAQYGGRGITVCERWQTGFAAFIEDMGPRPSSAHSLDRFPDQNGNYEPGNVRWATSKEQQRNRRVNRLIEFRGQRKTMAEWAEITGLHRATIQGRLNKGWEPEQALTTPPDANALQYRGKGDRRKCPRQSKYTAEQISQLRARVAMGESTRHAATALGISKSAACEIVLRQGIYAP